MQAQDPRGARLAVRARTEGVTAADVERALVEEGALTRPQMRERLDAAGVPTAGQALVHLLFLAALRGIAVRGPTVGKEHAFVLVRDWLGKQRPVDREAALAELARRYLVGTGRQTTATWRAGRGCRCATRGRGWRRSRSRWSSVRTVSSS